MIRLAYALVSMAVGAFLMLANMWGIGAGVIAAGILLPIGFAAPEVMVLLLIFSLNLQVEVSLAVTPAKLMTPLVALIVFIHMAVKGTWRLPPRAYSLSLLAFVSWAMIRDAVGSSDSAGWFILTAAGTATVSILAATTLRTSAMMRQLALVLAANLLICGTTSLFYVRTADLESELYRTGGLTGEPNWMGETVGRFAPLAGALILDPRSSLVVRAVGVAAICAGIVGLFTSLSRGGTLSLVIGMLAFAVLVANSVRTTAGVVGIGALIVTGLLFFGTGGFEARVLGTFGIGEHGEDRIADPTSGRTDLMLHAIDYFLENPWTGGGTESFTQRQLHLTGRATVIHNGPMTALTSYGIPSLIGYLGVKIAALLAAVRSLRRKSAEHVYVAAYVASYVGALVNEQSLHGDIRNTVWLGPLIVLLFDRILAEEAAESRPSQVTAEASQPMPGPPGARAAARG